MGNDYTPHLKAIAKANYFGFAYDLIKDARKKEFLKQQLERGFDDSELWNLDYTIAKFILPRLKRYEEITNCVPSEYVDVENLDEWKTALKKMIEAFELLVQERPERSKEVEEGLALFVKHFTDLWS